MMGLFPLPAQTTFLMHSPWFEHLSIDLGSGKRLVINSTGGDNDTSIHVQSLKVNGQEWHRFWLRWNDIFADGGTLGFELCQIATTNGSMQKTYPRARPVSLLLRQRIYKSAYRRWRSAPPATWQGLAITPKTREERDRRRWYLLLSLLILLPIVALGIYIFRRSRMGGQA
ncbi:hypothetical protein GJ744_009144 [Endocarpon pusillum]|uniref:Glycosyl hydrolase family 92 domain-containing protein n=1 Tax=Endocarpon pusillum TaxID=364733 RepID=A0A8H7AP26_9EURO|nr:hypothetical protein GJ744_009144 [Endocarpon pusillum]